jgi:glucose/arabinose dehydrogenase
VGVVTEIFLAAELNDNTRMMLWPLAIQLTGYLHHFPGLYWADLTLSRLLLDYGVVKQPARILIASVTACVAAACGFGSADPLEYHSQRTFEHVRIHRTVGVFAVPGSDSTVVILQQDGTVFRANLHDGESEPEVFLELEGRIVPEPDYEEGLIGLAFAPDYETSGNLYVNYTAHEPRRNVISRFTVRDGVPDPDSERIVLEIEQPSSVHNGGALAFGVDGYLYIASGDGGSGAPSPRGQRLDDLLGAILRVDVSEQPYAIPPDNPFVEGDGSPEIFAYGLRNPWQVTVDMETGDLWAADVGEDEWEEVNRIESGGNYGWRVMEGPDCFRLRPDCDKTGLIAPRAAYRTRDEGCAVAGGYVYRGLRLPELYDWYLYGDFCSGRVWAFNTADDHSDPVLLAETGLPITSFFRAHDGEVYIVSHRGGIHRLIHGEPTPEP